MDQREMDAINPEIYREARSAIMGDDPTPEPDRGETDKGLDESSTVKDNEVEEQPASGNEEHAKVSPESDTPETPGPEQPELSPPPKTRFAGREFDNLEQAELSYKEQQARATRAEQELAEQKRIQAHRDTQRLILAPVDQLSQDEYARLEQDAAKYDMDVRSYRGMVKREAEKQAAQEEEYLSKTVDLHITSHPQFEIETDREFVKAALEEDPYLLMVPEGLDVQQQERLLRSRLDKVFHAAAKTRTESNAAAREAALKKAAISEHEKKLAQAKGSASTEAGSTKATASSPKPATPGDAGDELLDMYRKRRDKHALR